MPAPVAAASVETRAFDVAADVARRLADGATLRAAVAACAEQTAFPTVGWRPSSLAAGHPSLALLFATLDAAQPGHGWDRAGHAQLALAVDAVESGDAGRPPHAALFSGLAGLGLAGHALAAGRDRYGRLLAAVDAAVVPHAESLAHRLAGADGCAAGELDVIAGLSGIGRYLLARRGRPGPDRALQAVLASLAGLLAGTGEPRRWHTPAALAGESLREAYPGGHHNCGLAHGVPGPLALLSVATLAGVPVAGGPAAIEATAGWLADHQEDDGWGPSWPNAVPLRDTTTAEGTPVGAAGTQVGGPVPRSRPTWCYGGAGVARALWLAGCAADSAEHRDLAVRAMRAALDRPPQERGITSPTLCHGTAGLVQIALRFAADTGSPDLAAAAGALTAELIADHEPASVLGYRNTEPSGARVDQPGLLDGAAGVALVLLAAAGVPSGWDSALLLS